MKILRGCEKERAAQAGTRQEGAADAFAETTIGKEEEAGGSRRRRFSMRDWQLDLSLPSGYHNAVYHNGSASQMTPHKVL